MDKRALNDLSADKEALGKMRADEIVDKMKKSRESDWLGMHVVVCRPGFVPKGRKEAKE